MLAHAQRCGVCGWRGDDDVCPRCGTVLLQGRAMCRRCGKVFEGPIARCDACGGTVEPPKVPEEPDAIDRLAHLPGVDGSTAKRLYARGLRDPADVLRLALPERAVRMGLHRAIARRLALEDLKPATKVRKLRDCPTCGTPRNASDPQCPTCGAPWERVPAEDEVRRTLEEVVGEVYDLASDPDFQELPDSLREELLETFEDVGLATRVESEYDLQFAEWRKRGLDTRELERTLREQGSDAFRANFVRLIRAQVLKNRQDGRFLCPLCDAALEATVEECLNCGAQFR